MHVPCRMILFSTLLLVSQPTAAAEPAADDYAQHLRQYDRRVQEQKEIYERQARTRWIPLVIFSGAIAYLIYSQIAARRRFQAVMDRSRIDVDRMHEQNQRMIELMDRSRIDVDRTLEQNQRMIELLESIDRKLDRPGQ